MTAIEAIEHASRIILVGVALLAMVGLVRHRDRATLDIVLVLSCLAVPVVIGVLPQSLRSPFWVATLSAMIVLSRPYLILRLLQHFRAVSPWIVRGVLGATVTSWLLLVLYESPRPVSFTLGLVLFISAVETFAAISFWRGALATAGVSRWRFSFAGLASGLLAGTILLVGLGDRKSVV